MNQKGQGSHGKAKSQVAVQRQNPLKAAGKKISQACQEGLDSVQKYKDILLPALILLVLIAVHYQAVQFFSYRQSERFSSEGHAERSGEAGAGSTLHCQLSTLLKACICLALLSFLKSVYAFWKKQAVLKEGGLYECSSLCQISSEEFCYQQRHYTRREVQKLVASEDYKAYLAAKADMPQCKEEESKLARQEEEAEDKPLVVNQEAINELEKELICIDKQMKQDTDFYFKHQAASISTSASSSATKDGVASIQEKLKAGSRRKPRTPSTIESKFDDMLLGESY